jgi:effector-binding domain-containing protein
MSRQPIQIIRVEEVPIAVIRGRVRPDELPSFVRAACGEVWAFLRSAGLPQPGRNVAVYLDGRGSIEVGVEMVKRFAGNDRVQCSALPAGRVANATHFGPYGNLGATHAAIREWCGREGYVLSGVCWEIYGHWQESWNNDSSKIQTDVFYLLRDEVDSR